MKRRLEEAGIEDEDLHEHWHTQAMRCLRAYVTLISTDGLSETQLANLLKASAAVKVRSKTCSENRQATAALSINLVTPRVDKRTLFLSRAGAKNPLHTYLVNPIFTTENICPKHIPIP